MASCPFSASRRGFLGAAGGLLAAGGGAAYAARHAVASDTAPREPSRADDDTVPFAGVHQAGIATAQQSTAVFAGFDLVTADPSGVARLLRDWTDAARRLTAGLPIADAGGPPPGLSGGDSGDARGLPPRRLTVTFGFGPGLFEHGGRDRYGLRARRPEALVDLPTFNGDQLEERWSGGDLLVQACADDQAVAFHAIRQLARLASGNDAGNGYGGKRAGATVASDAIPPVATLCWMQTGFVAQSTPGETPRNLLGFKDGTLNPGCPHMAERADGRAIGNGSLDEKVWVESDAANPWMSGGTYLVFRRIRLSLEHWDRTPRDFQEQVIGRRKDSGAPLTGGGEFTQLDLDATDADGNPVIAENAHVRLASASANDGARILRRSYSYNDGLSIVAERWPPWRQGLEYDAGLLFTAFGRDPRDGFVPMFQRLSRFDLLNQFATHVGSAVFAIPGGVGDRGFVGEGLFASV